MIKDEWSFFTNERLDVINKLTYTDAVIYIEDELDNVSMLANNKYNIREMVERSGNKRKLVEGCYNFRLAAMGMGVM
jgi:hypothetical protein